MVGTLCQDSVTMPNYTEVLAFGIGFVVGFFTLLIIAVLP